MKQTKQLNSGLSIHCHHNALIEYCYDYKERVKYIKENKFKNEQEIRLRLFKILPKEAEKDLLERYLKAYTECKKADAKWIKTYAEWKKANTEQVKTYTKWIKANAEWTKAYAEWEKAYAEWPQKSKDAFHKKWCGCKEWNGKELVFNPSK